MAFCTNCGATVAGSFCRQCGQPAAATAAPPPPPAAAPAPVKRKTSPIVWVLIVVLGLFVLAGVAVVGAGLFVFKTAQRAGLDPELMRRNPALAAGKLIAAVNPDLEVLNVNEGKGTITVRQKSDGKVISLNFDDVKRGRIVIADENEGKTASIDIGASAGNTPAWVPSYPGAKIEGNFAVDSGEGKGGSFSFKTSDEPAKVLDFYKDALTGAGFKITTTASAGGSNMLAAEDKPSGRHVMITASGGTVNVIFGLKKTE